MHPARDRWAGILHEAFEFGIAVKALLAAAETLLGFGLLMLSGSWIETAARWLTASELTEDPSDWLSGRIMAAAQDFSISTQHFWATYLIGHGVIKLLAVGALFARMRWAYPLSMLILAGFIVWQMQKWLVTHSAAMLGLSIFDLFVIWLIWQEFKTLPARP